MIDRPALEASIRALLALFAIDKAPIALEKMLQTRHPQLWEGVDVEDLSLRMIMPVTPETMYQPRMSMARMIGRKTAGSPWGIQHGLEWVSSSEETIESFARALVMPERMVLALSPANRTVSVLSEYFEVPPKEVAIRLNELKL